MLDSANPTLAELRPFLRESQPVSRDIASATRRLEQVAPDLRTSFAAARPGGERGGIQPARVRGGLPLLDRVVLPQRELGLLERGRARRDDARPVRGGRRAGAAPARAGRASSRRSSSSSSAGGAGDEAGEVSRGSIFAALAFAFSCFCLILFFWVQFGGSVPLKAQGYRFKASFAGGAEHDARSGREDLGRVGRQGGGRRALRPAHRRDHRARLAARADPRRHPRDRALQDAAGGGVRGALARRPHGAQAGGRRAPARAPGGAHAGARPGAERVRRAHPRSRCGASCPSSPWPSTTAARTSTPPSATPSRPRRTSTAWSGCSTSSARDVRGLVRDSATVLAAVGRREGDLQSLVTAGNDVLSTTAARNRELTETVRALPGFLVDLRGSLRKLDRAGAKVAPDVRTLRTLAPRLRDSLVALDGLTPEFGAFFEELRPVMRAAKRGLPAATAIFKATGPLFGVVYPASRELGPIFSYFNAYAHRHGEHVREGRRRHRGHPRGPPLPAHAAADHQREPGRRRRTGRPPTATTPTCARAACATSRAAACARSAARTRRTRRRCPRSGAPPPAARPARGRSAATRARSRTSSATRPEAICYSDVALWVG